MVPDKHRHLHRNQTIIIHTTIIKLTTKICNNKSSNYRKIWPTSNQSNQSINRESNQTDRQRGASTCWASEAGTRWSVHNCWNCRRVQREERQRACDCEALQTLLKHTDTHAVSDGEMCTTISLTKGDHSPNIAKFCDFSTACLPTSGYPCQPRIIVGVTRKL